MVFGGTFHAAVPAVILSLSVQTELSVGFVVPLVIRDEIRQGKSIESGDSAENPVLVRDTEEKLQEVFHHIVIALDKAAQQSLKIIAAGDKIGK